MTETPIDRLFTNAGHIMHHLGDTFTTLAFIRQVARDDQTAYIHLLHQHIDDRQPFAAAHAAIEARLREVAPHFGYLPAEERTLDTDIFGKLQKVTLYRRVSDVVNAEKEESDEGDVS